jgi:hypothetical protein
MKLLCVDPANCAEVCSMAAAHEGMAAQLAGALAQVQLLRAALMAQEATTAAVMVDRDEAWKGVQFHLDGFRQAIGQEATR